MVVRRLSLGWRIFAGIEIIAVLCWSMAGLFRSVVGPFMWGTQFLLLMPGNITAAPVVEHLLWQSGLSLRAIAVAALGGALVVNALVWSLLLWLTRSVWCRYAL